MATEGKDEPSRGEKIALAGKDQPYPDLETTQEMAEYLVSAGCGIQTGMGFTALTSSELALWARGTATKLTPWQFQTLLQASRDLVQEYHRTNGERHDPPWSEYEDEIERKSRASRQIREAFEALAASREK